jgi:hypothetical protein
VKKALLKNISHRMVKNFQAFIKHEVTFQLMIARLWGGTVSNLVHWYKPFRTSRCFHHEGKALKSAIFLNEIRR